MHTFGHCSPSPAVPEDVDVSDLSWECYSECLGWPERAVHLEAFLSGQSCLGNFMLLATSGIARNVNDMDLHMEMSLAWSRPNVSMSYGDGKVTL